MKKIFLILLFTCFFAEQNMCLIPQYDKMQQRGCCSCTEAFVDVPAGRQDVVMGR